MKSARVASTVIGWIAFASLLAACGPSIVTANSTDDLRQPIDGAYMSYAFARAEMSVSASFKSQALTISTPTITAFPDLKHVHTLVYRHSPIAIDQPDIQLDGVLLKQVSSSTQDQSATAITAANTLLTQVAATQLALAGPAAVARALVPGPGGPAPTPTCPDDIQVTRIADITLGTSQNQVVQQGSPKCKVILDIKNSGPIKTFMMIGYPRAGDENLTESYCDEAICFRLTAAYRITIAATLLDQNGHAVPGQPSVQTVQQVLAPRDDAICFVRFNRRAFSLNSTSLSFTNGMVSEFKSNDPSEVVGFLAVPAAALATAAIVGKGL
jgi:hypothetical protein